MVARLARWRITRWFYVSGGQMAATDHVLRTRDVGRLSQRRGLVMRSGSAAPYLRCRTRPIRIGAPVDAGDHTPRAGHGVAMTLNFGSDGVPDPQPEAVELLGTGLTGPDGGSPLLSPRCSWRSPSHP